MVGTCVGGKQVNNIEKLVSCEVNTKARGDGYETKHTGFVRHLKRSQLHQNGVGKGDMQISLTVYLCVSCPVSFLPQHLSMYLEETTFMHYKFSLSHIYI